MTQVESVVLYRASAEACEVQMQLGLHHSICPIVVVVT